MKWKSHIYAVTLIFIIGHHQSITPMERTIDSKLKIIEWLTIAVGTHKLGKAMHVDPLAELLHDRTNLDVRDIAGTLTMASTLQAFSYLLPTQKRQSVQRFATRYPAGILLTKLLTSKLIKQSTATMPLIGWYLGCPNTECTGSCNACTLKTMFLFGGIMRLIM